MSRPEGHASSPGAPSFLDVRRLGRTFRARAGWSGDARKVHALQEVTFSVERGESVGLVGESGCGKSTLAHCIVGLLAPTTGEVRLAGEPVHGLRGAALRALRRRAQLVFQDPLGSLDPKMTVGAQLAEPLAVHGLVARAARATEVVRLLAEVGLPADALQRYPHAFSGGQRQRIGLARALAVGPELLVADEPVSALDVSVQAQILNLLMELRQKRSLTLLVVSHDLHVVRHLCPRTLVLYLGRLVEDGPSEHVLRAPAHPYTAALVTSLPSAQAGRRGQRTGPVLQGEVPSPLAPPPGCPFHPRCPRAAAECRRTMPVLGARSGPGRVACHHPLAGPNAPS